MNQPNPYQPPSAQLAASGEIRGDRAYLRLVAKYQKGVLLCILGGIVAGVLQLALPGSLRGLATLVQVAISVTSVVFAALLAKTVYNTAAAVVYAIVTFIPCLGLIALLVMNQKATSVLQSGGVKVGLLGADLSKL